MGTIFSDDAGTFPRGSNIDHPALALCQREIKRKYGHEASILRANKTVRQFGNIVELTQDVKTDVNNTGNIAETYLTDNLIDYVVSNNAADLLDEITLEGYTIDGDGNFTEVEEQTIILNGQTPVPITTPLARLHHMYNSGDSETLGKIFAYKSGGTVTGGVPQTTADIYCTIEANRNHSFKAAHTTASNEYLLINSLQGDVERANAVLVDFVVEIKKPGEVFREIYTYHGFATEASVGVDISIPIIVPPNSDVRVRATASAPNAGATAMFAGYVAQVI